MALHIQYIIVTNKIKFLYVWLEYIIILIPSVSTNSCGSIVVEERNFVSVQLWVLWVQYWVALWRLNFWSPKSCVTVFINHLASPVNPSCNIVIEEHKLSFVQRVQCHLVKLEFIDNVCLHEQDDQCLSPWSNLEKRYNVYIM